MEFLHLCRFQSLVSLLKAYSNAQDGEKTAEILRLILEHGMVLPTTFVRDVCWRAGVGENTRCVGVGMETISMATTMCLPLHAPDRNKLVSQFSRNDAVGDKDKSSLEAQHSDPEQLEK